MLGTQGRGPRPASAVGTVRRRRDARRIAGPGRAAVAVPDDYADSDGRARMSVAVRLGVRSPC